MMLPNRISARHARPAVALLMVGCLVSFTLGQQLGYALRYPELHASTIPTAHAAGQLGGRLSAPSGPSGQQAHPVVTTPPPSHSVAAAPATKQDAARHGKKDKHDGQEKHDGKGKHSGQQGNPTGQAGHDTHQKGGDGHGHPSDD
jgi:hypothetical protein